MLNPARQPGRHAPPTEVSISGRVPLSMLHALGANGLDADALARAAGLDPAALAHPDGRVPGAHMERLWGAAVRATGDPHLGLHLGAEAEAGPLSVVGYVLQSAATLGDALGAFAHYVTLFTDGLAVRVARPATGALGGEAALEMETVGAASTNYLVRQPRQPMEATVAGAVAIAGTLVGKPLPLVAVEMAHAGDAGAAAEAARVFGVGVQYGAERYRIRFASRALAWPVRGASPSLLAAFETQAAAAAEAFAAQTARPVTERALRAVAERLRGEVPTIQEIAAALAVGVRTLQRRLGDEGTRFSDVLDEARHALALQHLATDAAVAEVGFLLGFSEPSAFTRAFRRWTGMSPTAYRRGA